MTDLPQSETGGTVREIEPRTAERRKLASMAYVDLGQNNGGILLNVSEGGLAVQSALKLMSAEFGELRFQLPNYKGWMTAKGRLAWINDSQREAGIQFVELGPGAREGIRAFVSSGREAIGRGPEAQEMRPQNGQGTVGLPAIAGSEEREREDTGQAGAIDSAAFVAEDRPRAYEESFQFNDYSMFAGAPSEGAAGFQATETKTNWRKLALLGICVAILFFVLGANTGRGEWGKWLDYFVSQTRGTPASPGGDAGARPSAANPPETTEKTGAAERGSENASASDESKQTKSDASTGVSDEKETSRDDATSRGADEQSQARMRADEDGLPAPVVEPRAAAKRDGGRRAEPPTAARKERSVTNVPDAAESDGAGRTILVNAPAPGSPAFLVNLGNEAVSASASVAISERRWLRIPPRAEAGFGSAERVTIGKLISHSEPFYPAEAREERLEGSVDLRATVGRTGEVINVTAVSGPSMLAREAAKALWEWRYEPTYVNGDPEETQTDVTMVFRVR